MIDQYFAVSPVAQPLIEPKRNRLKLDRDPLSVSYVDQNIVSTLAQWPKLPTVAVFKSPTRVRYGSWRKHYLEAKTRSSIQNFVPTIMSHRCKCRP